MAGGRRPTYTEKTHRLTVRLNEKDYERLAYWAEKKGYDINAFIPVLLDRYVGIENGDYELPVLEVQRLNQLVELISVMSRNIQSLETITVNGFDSLLQLTHGDSYFVDADAE